MVWAIIIFFIGLGLSVAYGRKLYFQFRSWEWTERIIVGVLPSSLWVALTSVVLKIGILPTDVWSGARLAASLGLLHGYKLYYGPTEGPVIGWIYGPLMPLLYLPAALAKTPGGALVIAGVINSAFFLLPALWLHFLDQRKNIRATFFALTGFLCFYFFVSQSDTISLCINVLHVEPVGVACIAFACIILILRKDTNSFPTLLGSSAFAVLSVWAKQIFLPIVVALPLYVLATQGWRTFFRYLGCFFITGVLISGGFLLYFGASPTWFNLWLPTQVPWVGRYRMIYDFNRIEMAKALIWRGGELARRAELYGAVVVFFSLYQLTLQGKYSLKKPVDWLRHNSWTMLVFISVWMIPTGLIGWVKRGGADNSLVGFLYFLFLATSLILVQAATETIQGEARIIQRATKILLALVLITVSLKEAPTIYGNFLLLRKLNGNPHQVAFEYAKKHPGRAYFPWWPLSSLMAEGKMYHFPYGVLDRREGGFWVSDSHFRAHIPSQMEFIGFNCCVDEDLKVRLPEFSRQIENSELPGWTLFARKETPPPKASITFRPKR